MRYRPDIDGLRAIAVLAVLLFHAELPGAGGGFVGVDVFFVISGYLITSLIVRDVDGGKFSLARFYERRFRRLLPALFTVATATSAAAWFLLLPGELETFGRTIMATAMFSANLYFWRTVDYFNTGDESPFLHAWSLGVEEQFYVLFPLALMALGSRRRLRASVLIVGFIASLALSEWGSRTHAVAAFYLLPTRAWELLAGSLLAVLPIPQADRKGGAAASWVGLALVLFTVSTYHSTVRFPGLNAIPPVAGTALMLWGGTREDTLVHRLLASAGMVWIGRISYSLYLWHWPVLVLGSDVLGGGFPIDVAQRLGLLAVSVLLAAATWKWIENPLRHGKASRTHVLGLAVAASLGFAGIGYGLGAQGGHPGRWDAEVLNLSERGGNLPPDCFGVLPEHPACRMGTGEPRWALWGDSHALYVSPAIGVLAEARGVSVKGYTKPGCPPLVGMAWPQDNKGCLPFNDAAFDRLRADSAIDTVILAARWGVPAHHTKPEHPGRLRPFVDHRGDSSDPWSAFDASLTRTVEGLLDAGLRVILVGTIPEHAANPTKARPLHALLGRPYPSLTRAAVDARQAPVRAAFEAWAAREEAIETIDLVPLLCNDSVCPEEMDGHAVYWDDDHINTETAVEILGPRLIESGAIATVRHHP